MIDPDSALAGARDGARTVDASLFRLLVDLEIRKAQRLRYCLCVLCIRAHAMTAELMPSALFLDHFRRQLRTTDVVAPWPPAASAFLLVDADWGDIPAVVTRITCELADGSWSAGGVCYPRTNVTGDEILRQASRLLEQALEDPVKRLHLA